MSAASQDFSVGELAFRLDTATGHVRCICFRGHEVLRGIYPAVRDPHWATILPRLAPAVVESDRGCTRISLSARVADPAIDLEWTAEIEAHATGQLRYTWRARALRDFTTNRTGLCVLHPAEAAGSPCTIEHPDASRITGWFPQAISPHQPFRNIRAITHVFAPGAEAVVRMEGEVFEMEDQRNWSDASFKTYCRPLDRPRPYPLSGDAVIAHTVTLTIHGDPRPITAAAPARGARRRRARATKINVTPRSGAPLPLPKLGFSIAAPLNASLRDRARSLGPKFIRVATTTARVDETLAWARREADLLGCELCLAIHDATTAVPDRASFPASCAVHLFDETGGCVGAEALTRWRDAGFENIGTGSSLNFTELNRDRPPVYGPHRLVTFGINAQVHAFDTASIFETATQHGTLARNAHALSASRPVFVGPIVLGPDARADPRIHTHIAAAWTLCSLAQLAATRCVEAACYSQLDAIGSFLSNPTPTPLEQLLQLLGVAEHAHVAHVASADSAVDALFVQSPAGRHLLLATCGAEHVDVTLSGRGRVYPVGEPAIPFEGGRLTLFPRTLFRLDFSA